MPLLYTFVQRSLLKKKGVSTTLCSKLLVTIGVLGCMLIASVDSAYAQLRITWNGSIDNTWGTPGNWTPAQVPLAGDTAVIPAVATNTPSAASGAQMAKLIVHAGGILDVPAFIQVFGTVHCSGVINATGGNLHHVYLMGNVSGTTDTLFSNGNTSTVKFNVFFDASYILGSSVFCRDMTIEEAADPNAATNPDVGPGVNPGVLGLRSFTLTIANDLNAYGNLNQNSGTLEIYNARTGLTLTPGRFSAGTGTTFINDQLAVPPVTLNIPGNITYNILEITAAATANAELGNCSNPAAIGADGIVTASYLSVFSPVTANMNYDVRVLIDVFTETGATLTPRASAGGPYNTMHIGGNWLNDGTFNAQVGPLPLGDGRIIFDGASTQAISGNGQMTLSSLYNNNAANLLRLQFQNSFTVLDSLVLNASFDIGNNFVALSTSGNLFNETPVSRIIATGGFIEARTRTAAVATDLGGLGMVITEPTGLTQIDIRRFHFPQTVNSQQGIRGFYTLSASPDFGLNVTMRYNYFQLNINGLPEDSLVLYRSSDGGATWTPGDCPTAANTTRDTVANYVNQTSITSLTSAWTLARAIPNPGGYVSNDTTICFGNPADMTLFASVASGFQWQDSISGGAWSDIAGETTATLTRIPSDTTYYRVKIDYGAGCQGDTSAVITVNVISSNVAGTISPLTASFCGSDTTSLTLSGYNGRIRWQFSSDPATNVWSDAALADTMPVYHTFLMTDTTYFRAYTFGYGCNSDTSGITTIFINMQPTGGTISPFPARACQGIVLPLTVSDSLGNLQWQMSSDSLSFTDILGATSTTHNSIQMQKTYYRVLVDANGCRDTSTVAAVYVDSLSVAGTVSPARDTICQGTIITLRLNGYRGTTINWQGSSDSLVFTTIATATADTVRVSPPSNWFYRTIVRNGVCPADTAMPASIRVNPYPWVGNMTPVSITRCKGAQVIIALPAYVSMAGDSLIWQEFFPSVGFFVDGTMTGNPLVFAADTTKQLRAKVVRGGCSSVASNSTQLFVDLPAIPGTVTVNNDTVCVGSQIKLKVTGYSGTIQWQDSVPGAPSWQNIPFATADSLMQIPPFSRYYRVRVRNNTCPNVSSNAVFVHVDPSSNSGIISADVSPVCFNDTVTLTTSGFVGTLQWQSSNTGSFYTDISGATSPTLTQVLTQSMFYKVTAVSGVCPPSVSPAFFENTLADVVIADPVDSICADDSLQLRVLSRYPGTVQWQESSDGVIFTPIPGVPNTDIVNFLPPNTGFRFYRAEILPTAGFSCDDPYSNIVMVYVAQAAFSPGISPDDPTLCFGKQTVIRMASKSGFITWESSANGINGWIATGNPADTSITYLTNPLTSTTYFRAQLQTTNGFCRFTSNVAQVVVVPAASAGVITSNNDSVCRNSQVLLQTSSAVGNLQWQDSIVGGLGWNNMLGQNFNSTAPTPLSTTYYRLISVLGQCNDTSNVLGIVVNPSSLAGQASGSKAYCLNEDDAILELVNFRGEVQWQDSSSTSGGLWQDTPGLIFPNVLVTPDKTTYYRAKVKSGVCSAVFSNTLTVTIFQPSIAGTITLLTDTACRNQFVNITLGGHTGTIQWERSSDSLTGWTSIGPPGASANFSDTISVPAYFRAKVQNGTCTPTITNFVKVMVVDAVAGILSTNASNICAGDSVILALFGSSGNIQWQYSQIPNIWVVQPGAYSNPYTTHALGQNTIFRAIVGAASCRDTSAPVTILVSPVPRGGRVNPVSQSICNNDTAFLSLSDFSGNIQWQQSTDSTFFTDVPGAVGSTFRPQPNQKTYYRAELSRNGCQPRLSNVASVEVLPTSLPTTGMLFSDRTIQYGTFTTLELIGSNGVVTWYESTDSLIYDEYPSDGSTSITVSPKYSTFYKAKVGNSPCFAYSNAVKVTLENRILFLALPNPADDYIQIVYYLAESQPIIFNVFDVRGRVVMSQTFQAEAGVNSQILDVRMLSGGMYMVNVENRTNVIIGKFIKRDQ